MNTVARHGSFRPDLAEGLLSRGVAGLCDTALTSKLSAHLHSAFAWNGPHIRASASFNWGAASDAEAAGFLRTLAFSRHPDSLVVFGSNVPALRIPTDWFLENLIEASCNAEACFVFGATGVSVFMAQVVELSVGRAIWASQVGA